MAFFIGIVTNLKIWYNIRIKSKERWALGNAPPLEKKTNYEKSITNRKSLQKNQKPLRKISRGITLSSTSFRTQGENDVLYLITILYNYLGV